jgi:hypothetical protein
MWSLRKISKQNSGSLTKAQHPPSAKTRPATQGPADALATEGLLRQQQRREQLLPHAQS